MDADDEYYDLLSEKAKMWFSEVLMEMLTSEDIDETNKSDTLEADKRNIITKES
jgi:hypothetical protein